jgi:hypothetical protein
MSTAAYADEKLADEKFADEKYVPAEFDDGAHSVNTLDALIAEGEGFFSFYMQSEAACLPKPFLLRLDALHEIRLRTMSWQKAAWLLAGDQVCLAIMAQTWSLS